MIKHYALNEQGEPYVITGGSWMDILKKWSDCFEDHARRVVKQEKIGTAEISTVFLGLDHNFTQQGPPILWETMVFGGKLNRECWRCGGSREQAMAQHERVVKLVKKSMALCKKK